MIDFTLQFRQVVLGQLDQRGADVLAYRGFESLPLRSVARSWLDVARVQAERR